MVYPHNFPNKKLSSSFLSMAKKPDGSMHECVSAAERKSIHSEHYDQENCVEGEWTGTEKWEKRKSWGDDGINDT